MEQIMHVSSLKRCMLASLDVNVCVRNECYSLLPDLDNHSILSVIKYKILNDKGDIIHRGDFESVCEYDFCDGLCIGENFDSFYLTADHIPDWDCPIDEKINFYYFACFLGIGREIEFEVNGKGYFLTPDYEGTQQGKYPCYSGLGYKLETSNGTVFKGSFDEILTYDFDGLSFFNDFENFDIIFVF